MSTVRADNFANRLGTSTIPVNTLLQGTAKAWFNLNGTGTIVTRDSFNVSSVTDNGTGDYTSAFAVAMPNANYLATPSSRPSSGGNARAAGALKSVATANYRFETVYVSSVGGAGTLNDDPYVGDAVFGDPA